MKIYEWCFPNNVAWLETCCNGDSALLEYEKIEHSISGWRGLSVEKAPQSKEKRWPLTDFPNTISYSHLISKRAADNIEEFSINGELLPITIEGTDEEYYIYYCTNIIDCLDENRSVVKHSYLDSSKIMLITRPAFFTDNIGENEIFVVPQAKNAHIFLTEGLVQKIRSANLKGMSIRQEYFGEAKVVA